MSQVAVYKGRKYALKFIGPTKYGRRAHLAFFDGSRDFWVDANQVEVQESTRSGSRGRHSEEVRCAHCGEWTAEEGYWCTACGRAG